MAGFQPPRKTSRCHRHLLHPWAGPNSAPGPGHAWPHPSRDTLHKGLLGLRGTILLETEQPHGRKCERGPVSSLARDWVRGAGSRGRRPWEERAGRSGIPDTPHSHLFPWRSRWRESPEHPAVHPAAPSAQGGSTERPRRSGGPAKGPTFVSGPRRGGPAPQSLLAAEPRPSQGRQVLLGCLGPISGARPRPTGHLRGLQEAAWQPLPTGTWGHPRAEGL